MLTNGGVVPRGGIEPPTRGFSVAPGLSSGCLAPSQSSVQVIDLIARANFEPIGGPIVTLLRLRTGRAPTELPAPGLGRVELPGRHSAPVELAATEAL
jgi:hypothetical protein